MAPSAQRTVPLRLTVVLVVAALVVGAAVGAALSSLGRSSASTGDSRGTTSSAPATPGSAGSGRSAGPSGFPDTSSTGVPEGTALSDYTGPTTITKAGTVIDAKTVTGCLVIKADDVTIKNSLLRSGACYFNVLADNGNTGLQLVDVEIDGQGNASSDSAVNGGGYTCLRCNVHGTSDGFKAGTGVTIKDSWIHDLAVAGESHNDGIQSLGTTQLSIIGNTITLAEGTTSAIILSTKNATDMRNVTIADNLLGGGAFTVYGGCDAGTDDAGKVSDIAITDNRFTTTAQPKSGAFGPLTSTAPPVRVAGNTWYDGPNAGKTVS